MQTLAQTASGTIPASDNQSAEKDVEEEHTENTSDIRDEL